MKLRGGKRLKAQFRPTLSAPICKDVSGRNPENGNVSSHVLAPSTIP